MRSRGRAATIVMAVVVSGAALGLAPADDVPAGAAVSSRVVGMASAPDGNGYLIVEADGTAHSYGSLPDLGDQRGRALAAPLVGGAVTPSGRGYWLFAADGGVFTHGDARFFGSAGNLPLVAPVVGGAPTPSGRGYWLFAADGGVFTYGDARFFGSAGNLPLVRPVIGIDATRSGRGYRLFAADGGEFDYGDALFISSIASRGVVFSAFAVRPNDDGHWLVTPDGRLQQSGLAPRLGSPEAGPPTAPPPPPPDLGQIDTRLALIASFDNPIAVRPRPGEPAPVLYVAEREGRIVRLDRRNGARNQVLDITGLTTTDSERGLLGFDFDPAGQRLYVVHTDAAGTVIVAEYSMSGSTAVTGTRRVVITVPQPFANHNGGDLHITPDGLMWLSSGDGGSGGDPQNNGQNLSTLLGKLLRIDPRPGTGGAQYRIPPTNPFVGVAGVRPEIWAYGLRNPWRISIDPITADVWIGDVGQGNVEEIDYQPAGLGGRNYGWKRFEGNQLFAPTVSAPGAVPPIHTYTHAVGCSVTGGPVYRGTAVAGLAGTYLFADYCSGTIWGLRHSGGVATQVHALDARVGEIVELATDAAREVIVVSLGGGIYQLLGA